MNELKYWPVSERPREKLLKRGAGSLSDAEILAVLFGSGTGKQGAMVIANELIDKFGQLKHVIHGKREQLCEVCGVGETKYAQLAVISEISKRILETSLQAQPVFHQVSEVKNFLLATLRHEHKEHFGLLCLNSQHHLIAFRLLFSGTINAAAVYPREIVRQVIEDNAAAVILVHNHPSGVSEPSEADIRLTKDIRSALGLIDVSVLDHFIVGDGDVLSLAQRGLM